MFSCFKSYRGWAALGFAVLGGYLVVWHGAHLAAALPFLVLVACPYLAGIVFDRRSGTIRNLFDGVVFSAIFGWIMATVLVSIYNRLVRR
jgi:Protein of unknown function (DUF2933)